MTPEHQDLIDRVREIDPGAADYLQTDAHELAYFQPAETLWGCFRWSDTPQGSDYWHAIAQELEGL